MYGGVSLAIYMNGVAQELLRLVKATAPAGIEGPDRDTGLPEDQLAGSEKVYRKLGQLGQGDERPPSQIKEDDPILSQFVIDILSGTSAGGINAVFLAKALANKQSMDSLSDLWIHEGDIGVLLNDKRSRHGLRLPEEDRPRSLLNSNRMYLRLLEAFDGMDRDDPSGDPSTDKRISPYVDELDLYVTTTDLRGLLLPIPLSNGVIHERRYRNVFRFGYSTEEASGVQMNDFHRENNPFLAFASRCTSAFPFAFEPMRLEAIDPIVPAVPGYGDLSDSNKWERFYRDYLHPGGGRGIRFAKRAFGDGGALDNKPFSYATERLLRRRADLPVDRKLIYIEPDPGHPEREVEPEVPPDVVQNALLLGVSLPRQENIRDDIQRIMDRNEVIRRVDSILRQVETDLRTVRRSQEDRPAKELSTADLAAQDMAETVLERGVAGGGYRRLRAEAVTDDVAAMMSRVVGYPEDSAYTQAIRYLVAAWRDATFSDYQELPGTPAEAQEAKSTLNWFLFAFDLRYRLRRLNFLQRHIDLLYRLTPESLEMLADTGISYDPRSEAPIFRAELLRLKRSVNEAYRTLRTSGRQARSRERSPLEQAVIDTGVSIQDLERILDLATEEERAKEAHTQYEARAAAFSALGNRLAERLIEVTRGTKQNLETAMADGGGEQHPAQQAARRYLRHVYDNFEDYDLVAFPMLYATEVGEADIVDIIRISPEDARSIIDVGRPGKAKVTGGGYMHFGAFLDRLWRENDILWGRLDAAEILIETAIAPDHPNRTTVVEELRDEAHREIIGEYFDRPKREDIVRLVAQALAETETDEPNEQALRRLVEKSAGEPVNEKLQKVLMAAIEDEGTLLEYYRESYQVNLKLSPKTMLQNMGRGAHIMGEVLAGAAEARRLSGLKKPLVWVSRIGQLLFGLVEASVPGSRFHLLWRHWLVLLYVFEILAILGGLAFGAPAVQQLGVVALVVTLLLNTVLWVLGDRLRGGAKWKVMVWVVGLILAAGVLLLAVLKAFDLGEGRPWVPVVGRDVPTTPTPTPTTPL
jgi:patatin-related protein